MAISNKLLGSDMDRIPAVAFRGMSFLFLIRGIFSSPGKKLEKFGIKPGDTVIDFGCGPGNYIKAVSELVGKKGVVYAADVHELAIKAINKKIKKYDLTNVKTVLVKDYKCEINDNTADIIYALDMFHMVKQPGLFLKEIHRILKKDGKLFIEDGHQPRNQSKEKIINSKKWNIADETKGWLVCAPV